MSAVTDPEDFSYFEDQAILDHRMRSQPKESLNLRFYIETVQNAAKTLAAGRPIFDMVEYVAINVPGSRDETIRKVTDTERQRFASQYAHWKKTQEQPEDGTPLSEVPFINAGQVRELAAINIKTLEHLAQLSDMLVQKIGMGGMDLRNKAQAYMKAATDTGQVTRLIDEVKKLTLDNDRLQQQVREANARYEQLLSGNHPGFLPQQPQAPAPPPVDIAALVRAELQKLMETPR